MKVDPLHRLNKDSLLNVLEFLSIETVFAVLSLNQQYFHLLSRAWSLSFHIDAILVPFMWKEQWEASNIQLEGPADLPPIRSFGQVIGASPIVVKLSIPDLRVCITGEIKDPRASPMINALMQNVKGQLVSSLELFSPSQKIVHLCIDLNNKFGDEALNRVTSFCYSLTEIEIQGGKLLRRISFATTQLTKINFDISCQRIESRCIESLLYKNATTLKELVLASALTLAIPPSKSRILHTPELQKLGIYHDHAITLSHLLHFSSHSMKSLVLSHCVSMDTYLNQVVAPALKTFSVCFSRSIFQWKHLTQVQKLVIDHHAVPINIYILKNVASSFPQLDHLEVLNTCLQTSDNDDVVIVFPKLSMLLLNNAGSFYHFNVELPSLRVIDLIGNNCHSPSFIHRNVVVDQVLEHVCLSSPKLEQLTIKEMDLLSRPKMAGLMIRDFIMVNCTHFTDEGLDMVLRMCPNLRLLQLSQCRGIYRPLIASKTLERIKLSELAQPQNNATMMQYCCHHCPNLKTLYLDAFEHTGDIQIRHARLQILYLGISQFTPENVDHWHSTLQSIAWYCPALHEVRQWRHGHDAALISRTSGAGPIERRFPNELLTIMTRFQIPFSIEQLYQFVGTLKIEVHEGGLRYLWLICS